MKLETELPEQHKAAWEKPELEICQLAQTQNAGGSGGDAGGQST